MAEIQWSKENFRLLMDNVREIRGILDKLGLPEGGMTITGAIEDAALKLIGGAPETLDSLQEIVDVFDDLKTREGTAVGPEQFGLEVANQLKDLYTIKATIVYVDALDNKLSNSKVDYDEYAKKYLEIEEEVEDARRVANLKTTQEQVQDIVLQSIAMFSGENIVVDYTRKIQFKDSGNIARDIMFRVGSRIIIKNELEAIQIQANKFELTDPAVNFSVDENKNLILTDANASVSLKNLKIHNHLPVEVGLGNVLNQVQMVGANNFSELTNLETARTTLGLGSSATKNVGTNADNVSAGNHLHAHFTQINNPHSITKAQVGLDINDDPTFANLNLSGNLVIDGNFIVKGETSFIDSTTIQMEDKNIELGKVETPTDETANGGGITLLGATNKTIEWSLANQNWVSNQNWDLATGKAYKIGNRLALNDSSLCLYDGSGLVGSIEGNGGLDMIVPTGNIQFYVGGTADTDEVMRIEPNAVTIYGDMIQRWDEVHADYVFDPKYKLESVEEHAAYMWENRHLKAIPPQMKDLDGNETVNWTERNRGIVEELEKAHIYIERLNNVNKSLKNRILKLEEKYGG